MGNTQARWRLNAKDFQYITSNTALLNMQMVTEYFNDLISKYPDGKMEVQDFKKIFHLAFPERKEAKVDQLAEKLRNIMTVLACSTDVLQASHRHLERTSFTSVYV